MLEALRAFVSAESPSTEKAAADRCARLIARTWKQRGLLVELLEQKHRGAHVRITYERQHQTGVGQRRVNVPAVHLAAFFARFVVGREPKGQR